MVGVLQVEAVDAEVGDAVAVGGEAAHEGDAQLVQVAVGHEAVTVPDGDEGAVGGFVGWFPPLGDGGQQGCGVAVVVPFGVVVERCPDGDGTMVWQALAPEGVFGMDAEEGQVVLLLGEVLPLVQDIGRGAVAGGGRWLPMREPEDHGRCDGSGEQGHDELRRDVGPTALNGRFGGCISGFLGGSGGKISSLQKEFQSA